jgi:hypothetical protein
MLLRLLHMAKGLFRFCEHLITGSNFILGDRDSNKQYGDVINLFFLKEGT